MKTMMIIVLILMLGAIVWTGFQFSKIESEREENYYKIHERIQKVQDRVIKIEERQEKNKRLIEDAVPILRPAH